MKTMLITAGIALAFLPFGNAAPCSTGSLTTFQSLTSGCSVGDLQFSNFNLFMVAPGSTAIAPGSITVSPVTAGGPGLLFTLNANATANQILEEDISYSAMTLTSGLGIASETLTQNGGTATGDGSVTGVQAVCFSGVLANGNCTGAGAFRNLGTFALSGGIVQTSDTLTFPSPRTTINVFDDFSLSGGTMGTASVTSFAATFTEAPVPEPATFVLGGLGLLGIGLARRRSLFASSLRVK